MLMANRKVFVSGGTHFIPEVSLTISHNAVQRSCTLINHEVVTARSHGWKPVENAHKMLFSHEVVAANQTSRLRSPLSWLTIEIHPQLRASTRS